VKITIFRVKLAHTVIFGILSLCVAYTLFSGIANRITAWTWVAAGLLADRIFPVCGTAYGIGVGLVLWRFFR
jgi:hypothetical protein